MTSAIRTNMNSVRAHNIFEANNAQATKSFNNVSTGLRINSVQDNPTNYVITEKMRERSILSVKHNKISKTIRLC